MEFRCKEKDGKEPDSYSFFAENDRGTIAAGEVETPLLSPSGGCHCREAPGRGEVDSLAIATWAVEHPLPLLVGPDQRPVRTSVGTHLTLIRTNDDLVFDEEWVGKTV